VRTRKALTDSGFGAELTEYASDQAPAVVVEPGDWENNIKDWPPWSPYSRPTLRYCSDGWHKGWVVAYPDGSTGKYKGAPSGYATVLTVNESIVHVGRGFCRASGNNFLPELVGILLALVLTPAQAPLLIRSDSEAAIGATNKARVIAWLDSEFGTRGNRYAISQRARAASAGRPVMNMIRALIQLREGPVKLLHVKAHSLLQDFHSKMNELADAEANVARVEAASVDAAAVPKFLWGEDRFRLCVSNLPVVGSYRKAILRRCEALRLEGWTGGLTKLSKPGFRAEGGGFDTPTERCSWGRPAAPAPPPPSLELSMSPLADTGALTKRLARGNPFGMRSLYKAVCRARDPLLRRFFSLVAVEQLPTERRLWRQRRAAGRGDVCKCCWTHSETVRHVYTCPHPDLVAARRASVLNGIRLLAMAGVSVVCSSSPPEPPRSLDKGVVSWVPVWFDTLNTHWMQVFLLPGMGTVAPVRDRLADVIGVTPSGVSDALDWVGHGSTWARRPLGSVQNLTAELQMALLVGALRTYLKRCAVLERWWTSGSADEAREARRRDMAKRKWGRDRKTRERPGKRHKTGGPVIPASGNEHSHSIAHRLTRVRVPAGRGANSPSDIYSRAFFVTDGLPSLDEYVEEAEWSESRGYGWGGTPLPYF
jgi:hypothetical protein